MTTIQSLSTAREQYGPALAPGPRPNPVRRDTDIILSYYQSDLPGQSVPSYTVSQNEVSVPRIPRARSASTTSSVSVYSPDSSPATSHRTLEEETSPEHHSSDLASSRSGHQRRPSNLSEGGSDKRRVQIVEFQSHPPSSSCPTESNSNKGPDETKNRPNGPLTRRELNSRGLALVMPPDASPESFTGIITPLTAPPAGSTPLVGHEGAHGQHRSFGDGHQRSASEASKPTGNKTLHHKSSSRDIGIVGTLPKAEPRHDSAQQTVSPIFQTPVTPTAPSAAPSTSPASEAMAANPARFTMPTIGERTLSGDSTSSSSYSNPSPTLGADRSIPSMSFSSADPSSYLYYEPGRHSKAGPLPPPPRAMFNIDSSSAPPPRPPRMRSPSPIRSRTALEITSRNFVSTPPLTSKRSTSSFPHRDSGTSAEPSPRQPVRDVTNTPDSAESNDRPSSSHVREGAFAPSTKSSPATEFVPRPDIAIIPIDNDVDSATSLSPPPVATSTIIVEPTDDLPSELVSISPSQRSWVSLSQALSDGASSPRSSEEEARSPPSSTGFLPVSHGPRGKKEANKDETRQTFNGVKGTLTNLKRFSTLPRTPTLSSKAPTVPSNSTTPSPPMAVSALPAPASRPPRPRIRSNWPASMWGKDVLTLPTALDRAMGYADKINDLAKYDCGLSDWVAATKLKASKGSSNRVPSSTNPLKLSPRPISQQPRHLSNGSVSSEATFPLRSDSYTATDLSPRPIDTLPPANIPPPALPYPALAQASTHRLSTVASHSLPSRSNPLTVPKPSGGFFSSIGRNYSLNKKEKGLTSAGKVLLTKANPNNAHHAHTNSNPRPVVIANSPLVPGGPRAAPGRMQRSQTLMLPPAPSAEPPKSAVLVRRRSSNVKRPSNLFGSRGSESDVPHNNNGGSTAYARDPDFSKQVDKLADLLPHADRDVLAGYLRRAGQDILAIGQYLDDEKNGKIRRD